MKKFLLVFATLLMVATGFSQLPKNLVWSKSAQAHATDVKIGAWKQNAPIAAVADGVYATGSYDKAVSFDTNVSLAEPEMKSAFLVKYSNDGSAKWAVALEGNVTITAVAADANGVVVAGVFMDEVTVGSKDGQTKTITGVPDAWDPVSGFIASYDVNGNLKAIKSFLPTVDSEIVDQYFWFEPQFTPKKLALVNGQIYVSAAYSEDSKLSDDMTLKGNAFYSEEMWCMMDVPSFALISFDRDLTNPAILYNVVSETSSAPQSFNFVVEGTDVYVAGAGQGKLTISGNATGTLEYAMLGDGTVENGMFVIKNDVITKYGATPTARLNINNSVDYMGVTDGKLVLVGTFSDNLPFDNSKTESMSNATYIVELDGATVVSADVTAIEKADANEREVLTGAIFNADGAIATGYLYDATYKAEQIKSNFVFSGGVLSTPASIITSISKKDADNVFVMSAEAGAYNLSYYSNTGTGTKSVVKGKTKANDKVINISGIIGEGFGINVMGNKKYIR